MNLSALREQTREQHEATESMLSLTGPDLDRERYSRTLQAFYSFVQGWESWALRNVPSHLAGLLGDRRRAALLLGDLQKLGFEPLAASTESQELDALLASGGPEEAEAAFLGSMYVLEGSTLGGQYIARHVEETLHLTPGVGDAYFRGHGDRTGAMWNSFRDVLRAIPEQHSATVIWAAQVTFGYVQERLRSSGAVAAANAAATISSAS